jgi:hypothetical protein
MPVWPCAGISQSWKKLLIETDCCRMSPVSKPRLADQLHIDPDRCPTLAELYGYYRQYLNHEHSLINQRLGWNFTIQGFLFTSYAFVLNKVADVRISLAKDKMLSVQELNTALHELYALLLVIAVIGICSSITIYLSVWGARLSMNKLRNRWLELTYGQEKREADKGDEKTNAGENSDDTKSLEQLSISHGYPAIMGGGDPCATKLGFHAPAFLSIAIAAAWALLLIDALRSH